jgi:ligand-binding sensor domain-containing protein
MKFDKIFILAAMVASGSAQAASLADAKGQVWVGREKGLAGVLSSGGGTDNSAAAALLFAAGRAGSP